MPLGGQNSTPIDMLRGEATIAAIKEATTGNLFCVHSINELQKGN